MPPMTSFLWSATPITSQKFLSRDTAKKRFSTTISQFLRLKMRFKILCNFFTAYRMVINRCCSVFTVKISRVMSEVVWYYSDHVEDDSNYRIFFFFCSTAVSRGLHFPAFLSVILSHHYEVLSKTLNWYATSKAIAKQYTQSRTRTECETSKPEELKKKAKQRISRK